MIGLEHRVWVGEHHEAGTYYRKRSGHEDLFMQGYKRGTHKGLQIILKYEWYRFQISMSMFILDSSLSMKADFLLDKPTP